ncbi:hypothetical protein [Streptomyces sp. NPDC057617]|uniref:hypothetical protein n=1 Tax=Streptomyces sp. NPDC057617 TaxID=3346184 RepID=UPI0036C74FA0
MTGPEHYKRAEDLAKTAARQPESSDAPALIELAHVHATLALAAATAMQAPVDGSEPGMSPAEFREWHRGAGVKPTTRGEAG